jgi:hypothetical protein
MKYQKPARRPHPHRVSISGSRSRNCTVGDLDNASSAALHGADRVSDRDTRSGAPARRNVLKALKNAAPSTPWKQAHHARSLLLIVQIGLTVAPRRAPREPSMDQSRDLSPYLRFSVKCTVTGPLPRSLVWACAGRPHGRHARGVPARRPDWGDSGQVVGAGIRATNSAVILLKNGIRLCPRAQRPKKRTEYSGTAS